MDEIFNTISTLVGSIGFPIVCCIFLWKYINETMKSFTETMNENTKMLTKLCEKFDNVRRENDNDRP
jgi:hypothetical protein